MPISGQRRLRHEILHCGSKSLSGGIFEQFGNISNVIVDHVFLVITTRRNSPSIGSLDALKESTRAVWDRQD